MNDIKINEAMKDMEDLYAKKDFKKLREIFNNQEESGERRMVANYYLQMPANVQVKKIAP